MGAQSEIRAVLVLIGFTSVIAQIVLMRELIVVFSGNEISLGLMLASWLLWTALGSSIAARRPVRHPRRLVAALEILVAGALPSAIVAARASKGAFQSVPGEILGPGAMLLISVSVLSFFCLFSGGLFAAGSRLLAAEMRAATAEATGAVYLIEALGSGAGGLLASLVLIRYFTAVEIALFLSLLNLLAAAAIAITRTGYRRATMAAVIASFVLIIFPVASRRLEAASLARLWRGFHLIASRNSVYGNLAVVETEGSRSAFENGLTSFTVPDASAAEEAVHYALLEHPSPKSLLLIGGGINGSITEALKHTGLGRLDYVELDPSIIGLARSYFPAQWSRLAADRRVHVHNVDGRLFLRTANCKYDTIIVNLSDPQTAQLNRFYTLEFFREAAGKLAPGGVFSFRLTAAENYISPELAEFLRCVNKTLHEVFSDVVTIPGEAVHFFAARQRGILVADAERLVERLRSRGIQTTYVREYYIPFRMMPDRMADLESQIRPRPETAINRDFTPVAYYFDVALWSARFSSSYRRLFAWLAQVRFGVLAGATLGLLAISAATVRFSKKARSRTSAGSCVALMGFTMIGLEMLLLLAFQAIYGYVYHQLAIVIAAFMAGMALGSWWSMRTAPAGTSGLRSLARIQAMAAAAPLILYALFRLLAFIETPLGLFAASQVVFPVLALCCGSLGGYQFPLASRIFFGARETQARGPGILYAIDLAGACLGALLISAYLIPVFGFLKTATLMAMLNLAPAMWARLWVSEHEAPPE